MDTRGDIVTHGSFEMNQAWRYALLWTELDPLWKPLLANARMVFIAYLVFQAKNLSKCVRFLARALETEYATLP